MMTLGWRSRPGVCHVYANSERDGSRSTVTVMAAALTLVAIAPAVFPGAIPMRATPKDG
jgi:hypothetical protein